MKWLMSSARRSVARSCRASAERGNNGTEVRMVALFREHGIKGWWLDQKLPGSPDFEFKKEQVAVFVDGCFWCGCPRCCRTPSNNAEYWEKRVSGNKSRDRRVSRELRAEGWPVNRVWECSLRMRPDATMARIGRALAAGWCATW